ncbi:TetR family transcriptional regulator C-terminal domain-containing protein [Echinicola jeungdonensis]|uniref:TetR/AcrR family transcriptional regulator n=1 Tax=Echinicola jeungdonensis TaxID=709343 RepID=A0ABV5J8T4_9BACT|nr:TetR family transcriptional regulator C-terminal domain-containing protein [Echinicola jeungdonensis]MDN3670266.1 TetR family transcriptional regulator C-terminal domain-containing protein [Echinicola jeungdonensis]
MEKTAVKKTTKIDKRKKILDGYKHHVLEHGREPVSVFKFSKDISIKETDFYAHFASFGAIKSAVWQQIFSDTVHGIESDNVYQEYNSREKLLAFFFTWIEELKKNRSYLLALYEDKIDLKNLMPKEMQGFKKDFKEFVNDILDEGKDREEIVKRPYISERYDEALWLEVMFIFRYWIQDESESFEKTDEAIEKSVNLAFDLMGKSALDTFVDFAKFLYQSK